MEIVTRVVACRISLEIHQIVDLNAFQTQNARIIWLASIDIVGIHVQMTCVVCTPSAMWLAILRSVNVPTVTLVIHSISVKSKKLLFNLITLIHVSRARAAQMQFVNRKTALAHANVCLTILEIHMKKAVDQNVR